MNEVGKFLLLDWVPQPQVALHSFTFLHSFFSILVSMKILCIYKQVWKSIHNKYKAFGSKCKHTRGKPNQQKTVLILLHHHHHQQRKQQQQPTRRFAVVVWFYIPNNKNPSHSRNNENKLMWLRSSTTKNVTTTTTRDQFHLDF